MSSIQPAKIRGIEVPINVDHYGEFHATWKDESYKADTRDGLIQELTKAAAAETLQIAIPFCVITAGGHLQRGVAHGIHARTGQTLARTDGKAVTFRAYDHVLADLSDGEFAELAAALDRKREAEADVARLSKLHVLPLARRVKEAVEAAAGLATD
jgi:hypothetical protein